MEQLYDVAVIGGGPAGLTAAIYLARARYRVIVIEKEQFGGQITITSEVVNYPGVKVTSGAELSESMRSQAQDFGAEFLLAEVTEIHLDHDVRKIRTSRGDISCFGILLATGAHPRMVGFEGEQEFRGHGVAYCATCDGEFFEGREVFVVGGGYAAAEESVFLTKYASHVTVMMRGDDFSCAESVAEAARNHEKITVLTNTEVVSVRGDTVLRGIKYRNSKTGEASEYNSKDTFGVFVLAGYEPETTFVRGLVELNEQGYIMTDASQKTSVEGVYAAGDVCIKKLRQVVTAVGDGAVAASELEHYASAMHKKTGIKPELPSSRRHDLDKGKEPVDNITAGNGTSASGQIFTPDVIAQMRTVFDRMEQSLILKLYLDDRSVSEELKAYMTEMAGYTEKLTVEVMESSDHSELPVVQVCDADGNETGLAFHGVPGGHEFTSFILGLYNAAGPGQAVDEETLGRVVAIQKPVDIQIMVSLSCTMCPELVIAAQRIASLNPGVRAEVYDLNHFPERKETYQVMSVPCFIINDKAPGFGKKNIGQLLDLIEKA